jgi:hypothetical protein
MVETAPAIVGIDRHPHRLLENIYESVKYRELRNGFRTRLENT